MSLEGKGWVILTGVLGIALAFFVVRGMQLSGQVTTLQRQVRLLQEQAITLSPSPTPSVAPAPEKSASAVPAPDLSTAAGRDAARKTDLQKIATALAAYHQAKGSYPPDLKALVPSYLPQPLTDPLSPKFSYRYQRTASGYKLTCVLESKNDPDDATDGKRDQVYTLTERAR